MLDKEADQTWEQLAQQYEKLCSDQQTRIEGLRAAQERQRSMLQSQFAKIKEYEGTIATLEAQLREAEKAAAPKPPEKAAKVEECGHGVGLCTTSCRQRRTAQPASETAKGEPINAHCLMHGVVGCGPCAALVSLSAEVERLKAELAEAKRWYAKVVGENERLRTDLDHALAALEDERPGDALIFIQPALAQPATKAKPNALAEKMIEAMEAVFDQAMWNKMERAAMRDCIEAARKAAR